MIGFASKLGALRMMGRGDFYLKGKEPSKQELISEIVSELKAKGYSVTPVAEKEANSVIRAFHGNPGIQVKDAKFHYCGVKLYIKDGESGNFTTYDGSDNGEPWWRDAHEVWCKHPEIEKGLNFSTHFEDLFVRIAKDKNA